MPLPLLPPALAVAVGWLAATTVLVGRGVLVALAVAVGEALGSTVGVTVAVGGGVPVWVGWLVGAGVLVTRPPPVVHVAETGGTGSCKLSPTGSTQ